MWLTILSDQLPVISLGGPLPHQLADRTQAHLKVEGPKVPAFNPKPMPIQGHIEYYLRFHEAMFGFEEDYLRVTHPFAAIQRYPLTFVQALQ